MFLYTLVLRENGVGTATVSLAIRLLRRQGGCGCESPPPTHLPKYHCTSLLHISVKMGSYVILLTKTKSSLQLSNKMILFYICVWVCMHV